MRLSLITPPTEEPLTVTDVKEHLRIVTTKEDRYLQRLIGRARVRLERDTGLALLTQTWDYYLDCWDDPIVLPKSPLQSVTHVKYYDTGGTQQTWSDDEYDVDTVSMPGRISTAYGYVYPAAQDRLNSIVVRMVCGFTSKTTLANTHDDLNQALLLLVSHFYENREPTLTGTIISEVPMAYRRLVANYRLYKRDA